MKNSWEWTIDDLQQLISDSVQESINLEFKESSALPTTEGKRNEFSKDVSAFANSAGGVLIYGIIEDGHFASEIDEGSDPNTISKESIEQVINSSIQRRIEGIKIKQITLNNNMVAYTIFVPQSSTAPHQARDKRFYKRYNFQSIPMEEYELRDVANRFQTPNLEISYTISSNEIVFENSNDVFSLPINFNPVVVNKSPEPAHYAIIYLYIDKNLNVIDQRHENYEETVATVENIIKTPILERHVNWGVNTKLPIFHVPYNVLDKPIMFKLKNNPRWREEKYLVGYKIESPRMATKIHFDYLVVKNGFLVVSDSSEKSVEA